MKKKDRKKLRKNKKVIFVSNSRTTCDSKVLVLAPGTVPGTWYKNRFLFTGKRSHC